ncbi:hypothetical protein ACFMJA_19775, partial [Acinetobacter baumannii]|uniref:hypothetical protein n=1 Tax=Acinetobacter baumannii TaxID=470 RepID=UPI00366FA924
MPSHSNGQLSPETQSNGQLSRVSQSNGEFSDVSQFRVQSSINDSPSRRHISILSLGCAHNVKTRALAFPS